MESEPQVAWIEADEKLNPTVRLIQSHSKKLWDTITVLVAAYGTLLVAYSVRPVDLFYSQGYPVAVVSIPFFREGIRMVIIAFVLQIFSYWGKEILYLLRMVQKGIGKLRVVTLRMLPQLTGRLQKLLRKKSP